ncbi:MAG: hypothetical protein IIB69_14255 [Proteobacteria bacterium]|nr:hypothetical protein [Pseudomonadota bacterium]
MASSAIPLSSSNSVLNADSPNKSILNSLICVLKSDSTSSACVNTKSGTSVSKVSTGNVARGCGVAIAKGCASVCCKSLILIAESAMPAVCGNPCAMFCTANSLFLNCSSVGILFNTSYLL